MKGDLKGFFLNHWKMDLPLTDVITTTDGGDLWGYEKLRSRIVKFEKHFRHPNADVTQADEYGSPEFMENVWPGVISIEVVFKTLDQIK